jgi:putative ATPase
MEAPLAERIRPQKTRRLISQDHLIGNGSLTQQIAKGIIPSLILWGLEQERKTLAHKLLPKNQTSVLYFEL